LRSADAQWWAMLHYAYRRQGSSVTVHWIRGHAGNMGNTAADILAKSAHKKETSLWSLHHFQHHDFLCHAQFMQRTVDQDVRRVLKMQSVVRHHQQWLAQHRTKEFIKDSDSIAWTPTLKIIHNNNPPKTSYTSMQDCSLRAHRIKKLHGMLPTLQQMRQRNPGIYGTSTCRRCGIEEESDHHLWNCSVTMMDQQHGWETAVGKAGVAGRRAWRQALRKWKEDNEKAIRSGKESTSKAPTFEEKEEEDIWASLNWIKGVKERNAGWMDTRTEEGEAHEWSVKDLYRGIVPIRLIDSWKKLFATTSFIATYMATSFVTYIEEFGRVGIWNKRCEDTAAWEKSVGITAMSKRVGERTGDGEHRRSCGDFSDLTRRRVTAPNRKDITRVADERVCGHFRGRLKMGIMERLHGLKTNLLTGGLDQ